MNLVFKHVGVIVERKNESQITFQDLELHHYSKIIERLVDVACLIAMQSF